LFGLNDQTNPHIRLKPCGNGWHIFENYRALVGVVIRLWDYWMVTAYERTTNISKSVVQDRREAAWLLAAWLQVDVARFRNDPIRYPIPENANALDEVWSRAAGFPPLTIPSWTFGTDSSLGRWESDEHGTIELIKHQDRERWKISRARDHRSLMRAYKPLSSAAALNLPFPFDSPGDAMQILVAKEFGWTGYEWL
jgi:hypothetical protein